MAPGGDTATPLWLKFSPCGNWCHLTLESNEQDANGKGERSPFPAHNYLIGWEFGCDVLVATGLVRSDCPGAPPVGIELTRSGRDTFVWGVP